MQIQSDLSNPTVRVLVWHGFEWNPFHIAPPSTHLKIHFERILQPETAQLFSIHFNYLKQTNFNVNGRRL